MAKMEWYRKTREEVYAELESSAEGLSSRDVSQRILKNGKNVLPTKKRITLFKIILAQFLSPLIYGLLAAAVHIFHLNREEFFSRNPVLMLLVLLQNSHALSSRSETESVSRIPLSNIFIVVFGILTAQGIHILALHIPFMQNLLFFNPINVREWVQLFFTASLILLAMEIYKLLIRKKSLDSQHEKNSTLLILEL